MKKNKQFGIQSKAEDYEGTFAYIILEEGEQVYLSRNFESQMDALRAGRKDAIERRAKGEYVEYDVVLTANN